MLNFCTYFDSNYLINGLALYNSLVRHATPFQLWILCLDNIVYEIFQKLSLAGVTPISLNDFEKEDKELLQAKANRSRIEYYFTCTPCLPLYILNNYPKVNLMTYLDSDLFFFSDPSPIFEELNGDSVLIVGHRFPRRLKKLEYHGIYNVGLLSFRRDDIGLQCLNWWRNSCLEWCYDREENDRYADQKYLDDWPTRFSKIVVLQHKGAGLAPWNVDNSKIHIEKGQVFVDKIRLIYFHFHGLHPMHEWLYDPNLIRYGNYSNASIKKNIYGPYLKELYDVRRWISLSQPANSSKIRLKSIRINNPAKTEKVSFLRTILNKIIRLASLVKKILEGRLWVTIYGKVI
jgi:hypothetical protein